MSSYASTTRAETNSHTRLPRVVTLVKVEASSRFRLEFVSCSHVSLSHDFCAPYADLHTWRFPLNFPYTDSIADRAVPSISAWIVALGPCTPRATHP